MSRRGPVDVGVRTELRYHFLVFFVFLHYFPTLLSCWFYFRISGIIVLQISVITLYVTSATKIDLTIKDHESCIYQIIKNQETYSKSLSNLGLFKLLDFHN